MKTVTSTRALFPLGRLVATHGALAALCDAGQSPVEFLRRHQSGDWGELDAADRAENEYSLLHGFRLLSAYRLSDGTRVWIITEADRSSIIAASAGQKSRPLRWYERPGSGLPSDREAGHPTYGPAHPQAHG